jgi:hypothetical protein
MLQNDGIRKFLYIFSGDRIDVKIRVYALDVRLGTKHVVIRYVKGETV